MANVDPATLPPNPVKSPSGTAERLGVGPEIVVPFEEIVVDDAMPCNTPPSSIYCVCGIAVIFLNDPGGAPVTVTVDGGLVRLIRFGLIVRPNPYSVDPMYWHPV
jgi:hypothetical protein